MKQHKFRKAIAAGLLGILTVSLCLSGGTRALAADEPQTGSITIENAIEGATYNFYRVADLALASSGNPEDGVSYTMSAEQFKNYESLVSNYDNYKESYEYYKAHPEKWNAETVGMDYETGMKFYEETLSSPILVNKVDGVTKVVLTFSNTSITAFPEDTTNNIVDGVSEINPDYSFETANEQVIADDLPLGYYIIIPEGIYETAPDAMIPINLTNITPDKVVKSKSVPFTIKKTADKTNVQEGDIITFTIEGTVPDDGRIYLADTMEGLILTGDWDLKVDGVQCYAAGMPMQTDDNWYGGGYWGNGMDEYSSYYLSYNLNPEDFNNTIIHSGKTEKIKTYLQNIIVPTYMQQSFCIGYTFSNEDIGKPFKLRYSAVANKSIVYGTEGNTNNAMAIYYKPTLDGEGHEIYVAEDHKTIYTYAINILKYANGDTSNVLPGAQFVLYKIDENNQKLYYRYKEDAYGLWLGPSWDVHSSKVFWNGYNEINQGIANGNITAVITDRDGKAVFVGLQAGTYYLHEVKAPEGYNVLNEDIEVVIPVDAPADFEVQVENTGGALLPETGGPGTVLFTIMGLLLMASATTVYLTARRKHRNNA